MTVPNGQETGHDVLTPVLLRRSGAGWRTRAAVERATGPIRPSLPRRPWWDALGGRDRTEMPSAPTALVLLRRGRVTVSSSTYRSTSETGWTIRTIAATRWRPVTSPVARFGGTRVANTSVRTVPAPVRAEMPAPHLTVSVLRPVAGRSREVRGSRLLRIESASTPVPGPAGPPGSTGTPGVAVVVRRTPVAAAAPAAAAVAPPMPFPTPRMGSAPAAAASGAGPEFDVEELTARVLRSIERRAAAQRERMGRD